MTEMIAFTVVGQNLIHCESCEQGINRALRRVPEIQKELTNISWHKIEVTFEPNQVNAEQIQAKLGEIGFEVTLEGRT